MQDIVNADSVKAIQTPFNTSFDIESMANFYAIGSTFPLAYYYSKERKDLTIEDDISLSPDDLISEQKSEIIRYIRFKKPY